jgi:hypothetical protein
MKLAIMQPYFFPYIGYFQLIHAVDAFVVYDDVNFIKGGWINRNFMLAQGENQRFTLPLNNASPNVLINQIKVGDDHGKILKSVQHNYSKAPYYKDVFPIIEQVMTHPDKNLAGYLGAGLKIVAGYLGLQMQWLLSSSLAKDNQLRSQGKVLAICRELTAHQYVNLPGGRLLYDTKTFEDTGIKLSFLQPGAVCYEQFRHDFVPNLSIIDVMMFNSRKECKKLLAEYTIV